MTECRDMGTSYLSRKGKTLSTRTLAPWCWRSKKRNPPRARQKERTGVFRGAHDEGDADRTAREGQAALTG